MNEWEWSVLEEHSVVAGLPSPQGELKPGTRVRIRPRSSGGDAMDLMLAGKTGVIESIEQDYERGFHVAVVLDDDPGRDLGLMRQPAIAFSMHLTKSNDATTRMLAAIRICSRHPPLRCPF